MSIRFKNYLRSCLLSNFEELMAHLDRMPNDLESIPPEHPDYCMKEYATLVRRFEQQGFGDTSDDIGDMLVDAMYQLLPDEIMI